MSDQLQTATELLLSPTGLGDHELIQTLNRVMGPQIDYADLYFQYSRHEAWYMDEGTVKSGSCGIDQGVGIRAVSGEKNRFRLLRRNFAAGAHRCGRSGEIHCAQWSRPSANQDSIKNCMVCSDPVSHNKEVGQKQCTACIDHDHDTGEVRGVVCANCNFIEGKMKASSLSPLAIARNMVDYLENPPLSKSWMKK